MGRDEPYDAGFEEHLAALITVRGAKRLFSTLVAVALAVQLLGYAAGRWGKMFEADQDRVVAATTAPHTQPESASGAGLITRLAPYRAHVQTSARLLYPITGLIGTISAGLLVLCMLLSISISLAGRLGGARSMIVGSFHAFVVVILLCPWDRWLVLEGLPVRGAFSSFSEVSAALVTAPENVAQRVTELVRFVGLPVVTFLFLVLVLLRFRRGFQFALERVDPETRLRML